MLYHTERDCYTLLLLSQFLMFPTSNVPTVPTGWVTCPVKSPVCQEAVLKKFRCSVWLHFRGVSFSMFVDFAVVTQLNQLQKMQTKITFWLYILHERL